MAGGWGNLTERWGQPVRMDRGGEPIPLVASCC